MAYVVIDPAASFDAITPGALCIYRTEWSPRYSVLHQAAAQRDGLGWIMSGFHNPRSESAWRITPQNFDGVVRAPLSGLHETPFTSTQHYALRGIVQVLLIAIGIALILFALSGCTQPRARHLKSDPRCANPGTATGAGATLTSPGNSATPTTQNATRRVYYPPQREPLPRHAPAVPITHTNSTQPNTVSEPAGAVTTTPAAQFPRPGALLDRGKTETTIGQHQDAAGNYESSRHSRQMAHREMARLALHGGRNRRPPMGRRP